MCPTPRGSACGSRARTRHATVRCWSASGDRTSRVSAASPRRLTASWSACRESRRDERSAVPARLGQDAPAAHPPARYRFLHPARARRAGSPSARGPAFRHDRRLPGPGDPERPFSDRHVRPRCGDRVLRSGRRERLQDGAQGVRQARRDEPGPGAAAGSRPRAPADRDLPALPAFGKPPLLGRRYDRLWRDGGARGRAGAAPGGGSWCDRHVATLGERAAVHAAQRDILRAGGEDGDARGRLPTIMTRRVGLDAVAGHEGAKTCLRETARALSQGRLDVVPMGYLICGPVGTGKSFIVQCFAKEIGIPVVELLNFRSKWQGQTEANLERVLALLDAIGPVAVVVDEADAALGTRETGGADSGVSERVFASLAAFMGDTRRRGKVIWFLMTSRPDLVPVDLKRQGRAEEHLALFPPATIGERVKVFDLLRARLGIELEPGVDAAALFAESRDALSAADLEAILVRGSRRMASAGRTTL